MGKFGAFWGGREAGKEKAEEPKASQSKKSRSGIENLPTIAVGKNDVKADEYGYIVKLPANLTLPNGKSFPDASFRVPLGYVEDLAEDKPWVKRVAIPDRETKGGAWMIELTRIVPEGEHARRSEKALVDAGRAEALPPKRYIEDLEDGFRERAAAARKEAARMRAKASKLKREISFAKAEPPSETRDLRLKVLSRELKAAEERVAEIEGSSVTRRPGDPSREAREDFVVETRYRSSNGEWADRAGAGENGGRYYVHHTFVKPSELKRCVDDAQEKARAASASPREARPERSQSREADEAKEAAKAARREQRERTRRERAKTLDDYIASGAAVRHTKPAR